MTVAIPPLADQPRLVFFHSSLSGHCRRVEGFLAQVLQRRRNHGTFNVVLLPKRSPDRSKVRIRRLKPRVVVENKAVARPAATGLPGSRAFWRPPVYQAATARCHHRAVAEVSSRALFPRRRASPRPVRSSLPLATLPDDLAGGGRRPACRTGRLKLARDRGSPVGVARCRRPSRHGRGVERASRNAPAARQLLHRRGDHDAPEERFRPVPCVCTCDARRRQGSPDRPSWIIPSICRVPLHRVRLVDVLDELLLQLSHCVQPPHRELTELAAEQGRPPEVGAVLGFELVDEEPQRVVQLPPAHFERQAGNVRKLRRPARAVNAFHASE